MHESAVERLAEKTWIPAEEARRNAEFERQPREAAIGPRKKVRHDQEAKTKVGRRTTSR